MEDENAPPRRPIRWNALRTDEAERVVREIARDRGRVVATHHAERRMAERRIVADVVVDILRTGYAHGAPERTPGGDWKVLMTKRIDRSREAGVVTVVIGEGERLVVVTVEWMDP